LKRLRLKRLKEIEGFRDCRWKSLKIEEIEGSRDLKKLKVEENEN